MPNRLKIAAPVSILLLAMFVLVACGPSIPEASFTVAPMEGAAALSVQFADTSENTSTSTEQSPVHEYQIAGTYDVTLVAANDAGSGTATTTRAITGSGRSLSASTIDRFASLRTQNL